MPKLEFRNVDLEMVFKKEPKRLLRELGRRIDVLYSGEHPGGHLVAMELRIYVEDPHKMLRRWIKLLGKLSPAAKQEFDGAISRALDIGFAVANQGRSDRIELSDELLTELAKYGTSCVITLYAAEPDAPSNTARKRSRL